MTDTAIAALFFHRKPAICTSNKSGDFVRLPKRKFGKESAGHILPCLKMNYYFVRKILIWV